MFDIGFIELVLCAVIALLVLGPERLPVAARATGRWIGKVRRMTRNFTSEMDRQLRADELREKIRKEGSDMGAEAIQRNFKDGLDQARKYTDYLVDDKPVAPVSGPASPANAVSTRADDPAADTRPASSVATRRREDELETEPPLTRKAPEHTSQPEPEPQAAHAQEYASEQKTQENQPR